MCKWKRTKGRNQQTDLKTKYLYYSCLHEVTFIKSPFECSNSNLVHQQNTIKQLFKLHSSKFPILLFQHNFFKGKKLKIRSYQEFSHEIQEKIRNWNNQENQEVLDRLPLALEEKIFFLNFNNVFSIFCYKQNLNLHVLIKSGICK